MNKIYGITYRKPDGLGNESEVWLTFTNEKDALNEAEKIAKTNQNTPVFYLESVGEPFIARTIVERGQQVKLKQQRKTRSDKGTHKPALTGNQGEAN